MSRIGTVTLQAAGFSALSTTLAQAITAWQTQDMSFDAYALLSFMAIAIIMTPPNYLYQKWLEDSFPTSVPARDGNDKAVGERLSKTHTVIKFFMDQTFGAMANTACFIVLAGLAQGLTLCMLRTKLDREFFTMLTAGWKLWPWCTLANLVIVPFDYRMMVGNVVGVCWGVYVTLSQM